MRKISLTIVFLSMLLCSCSYMDKYTERKIFFEGVIIKIFFDDKNHYSATFTIKQKDETFLVMASLYPNSWEYANIGDSIIKEKGELYLTIKKKNGDATMFPYWQ